MEPPVERDSTSNFQCVDSLDDAGPDNELQPWKIAVIDDDQAVHSVTRLVLKNFRFKGRSLKLLNEYSMGGALRLLDENPDIAVMLVDVVMETENAGLDLVTRVRKEINNRKVRIILRTGQPGQAPEQEVITKYDINDYKEKADLTSQKLITSLTTALRSYDDFLTIQELSTPNEKVRKLSAAMEQTADSVMITDANGIIEYVNNAFTDLTGFSREESLGNTPRLLKSGNHPQIFYRKLWQTILNGEVFRETMVNLRKDGREFYELKTITPQRDEQGNISHFISTGRDVTEQVRLQDRLTHMAQHDPLTGLPNRVLLMDRIEQGLARSRWQNRTVGVLFIDLDRFKVINDTLGHSVGDELLTKAAKRLIQATREGDTVARIGGDEFAVILNDVASHDDVRGVVEKIIDEMRVPYELMGRELYVTSSIGISLFPDDGDDAAALIKKADVAMYQAKSRGKNTWQFYSFTDDTRTLERLGLETRLRHALDRGEFLLYYQPKVSLESGRIEGAETLIRWRPLQEEVIAPARFIHILEETGLIIPVGEWVLRTACQNFKALHNAGFPSLNLSVNLSMRQFWQQDIARMVRSVLLETGLAPELLEIEVTEDFLFEDINEARNILNGLKNIGVQLSIDDFGMGYSSMQRLRHLPFDIIKIDRTFIDDPAIVSAMVTLGHALGMELVAEGVETEAQRAFLKEIGCEMMQGYLFSPPLSLEDFKFKLGMNHPEAG